MDGSDRPELRRREDTPVVFREGPAGRRAALAVGPDVWEVIETLQGTGERGEAAIAATAEWGGLAVDQVQTAVAYYGDHREEIDEWIAANRVEAAKARAAWERS